MKVVRGAIHIHSSCSDGSGSVSEIVEAAAEAGLDFLILTDHDTLLARDAGWEGWHGNVLLAVGAEITPGRGGHVLAFNVEDVEGLKQLPEEEFVRRIRRQGGSVFIAHPEGRRRLRAGVSLKGWKEWHLDEFQGIEIWSFMHDWIEKFRWCRAADFLKDPGSKISGPDPEVLETWDRLLMVRKVVAIGGLDAHAKNFISKRWQFLPYRVTFDTILTYVLIEGWKQDDKEDLRRLYEALIQGRSFIAFDYYFPAKGFSFYAEAQGKRYEMGESVPASSGVCLLGVLLPDSGEIVLKRDGEIVREGRGKELSFETSQKGAYRVEVSRTGRPWIYSNPIFIEG